MKLPIKIVYNAEDKEYIVFVEGMSILTGFGETEEEAIKDFYRAYEKFKN